LFVNTDQLLFGVRKLRTAQMAGHYTAAYTRKGAHTRGAKSTKPIV